LPSSATSNPLPEATVIAVGPGAPNKQGETVPTSVKAGDRVLLPGWGGNSIKLGEEVRRLALSHVPSLVKRLAHIGVFPLQGLGNPCQDPGMKWGGQSIVVDPTTVCSYKIGIDFILSGGLRASVCCIFVSLFL
jgi:co-chaperonin GroES (HSP10)